MEKMVNCPNWKEYESLNGWMMFCSAGAYARKLSKQEAESCGCTAMQRTQCLKIMMSCMGYGLVPELASEKEKEVAAPAIEKRIPVSA